MLDILTAGRLTDDLKLLECAIKELDEEASINGELLNNLKPVGAISYAYETFGQGIHREVSVLKILFQLRYRKAEPIHESDDKRAYREKKPSSNYHQLPLT
jgi:hypothetical protein